MTTRQLFTTLLIFILLAMATACDSDPVQPGTPHKIGRDLTILYFNDFHGHMQPFKRFWGDEKLSGGLARMASVIRKIREENELRGVDTLVLSGGDNVQGTPMSTAFEGEAEIRGFNAIGINASATGNHDFDFGSDRLFELVKMAEFPFLSANIYTINGSELIFKPYLRKETKNGLNIAIIGLTTPETPITTHPKNVTKFRFTRPELAMQRYLKTLKKKNDIVIALSHLGAKADRDLARSSPDLDIIIGGHSHSVLPEPLFTNGVMICQSGARGLYLGRLDVEYTGHGVIMISNQLIPINDSLKEDPAVAAVVQSYADRLSAEYGRKIGVAGELLDAERHSIRSKETNLGDLISDLIRLHAKTDVALVNSGGIRSSVLPGDVTLGDAIRAFPMDNHIITMELPGSQLLMALNRSAKYQASAKPGSYHGGFLQVSGLRFGMNRGTLRNVLVNNKPLKLNKTYTVATVDFLAAGGDGYKELAAGKYKYDTGNTMRDLFVDYIEQKGTITAKTDGRMVIE